MRILITGIGSYIGSRFAQRFLQLVPGLEIYGIDNLSRPAIEPNLAVLPAQSVKVRHADLRIASDIEMLPRTDWVIDCAGYLTDTPSATVPAENCNPDAVAKHSITATLNILSYCRQHSAGLILLNNNRVYSLEALAKLPVVAAATRFEVAADATQQGFSVHGIAEDFSSAPPVSLSGAAQRAAEVLAREYACAFNFPVWINRCGSIDGWGQAAFDDLGAFSFWVYSAILNLPLAYVGFGSSGKQVRDMITPEDVAELLLLQMQHPDRSPERLFNVGGGNSGSVSLLEMTAICESYLRRPVPVQPCAASRPADIAYYVSDIRRAEEVWGWKPAHQRDDLILELCRWSTENIDLVKSIFKHPRATSRAAANLDTYHGL